MQRTAPGTPDGGAIGRRADALFREHRLAIDRRTDRLFAALLGFQWLAAMLVALLVSPRAWAGGDSQVDIHIRAALLLGGAIVSLPVALAVYRPGAASTRHAVAVGQSLMGALLIHLSGGRIETHFHIFGSLALLAFYRDWRVLLTSSAVVVLDHLVRGHAWPRSVYGVLAADPWRWAEHAGWVAFEDVFLIRSCIQGVREMRATAVRQAHLEAAQAGTERTVRERTVDLEEANHSLADGNADLLRADASLRESEARFRSLCACSPTGIYTTDRNGLCTYVNPRAREIVGFTYEEALGDGWQRFLHEEDSERVLERWGAACGEGRGFEEIFRFRSPGGGIRWVHFRAAPQYDEPRRLIGLVGTIEDMTDRKQAEDDLAHQATHDMLTGLPNRVYFQQRLEAEVASAGAGAGRFALLLIDLDRFKEINDAFGHHCGDAVLQQLRPRLREGLRQSDLIARLGGDEFAVLLPEADQEGATLAAERLLEALERPIVLDGRELDVGASIGIALYPGQGEDAATLMRHADVAMYAAKRDQGGYSFHAPGQSDNDPRRLSLASELRHGIDDGQLVLHYQPKIDLKTMRVSGAEALVRWQHPRDGMVPPDLFIPLAEHTGLIKPLGLWTLHDALRQCRLWDREGLPMKVAVNLAPKNLRDPRLMDAILGYYDGPDDALSRLTLEITEGAMMAHPGESREVLGLLHELGVRISIDDFGTGYSSLAYLQNLPVDEVKIGRCFVRDMGGGEKGACIVRSVIDLGHSLGLQVVAEGVEDRATLDLLAAWGCDLAQGYLFTRPLPAAQFTDWAAGAFPDGRPLPTRKVRASPSPGERLEPVHP